MSQGEQLGLPGGELGDARLHLSSDILQALGDGRLAVGAADARGRGEELLHAGHLSRDSSQLVEGRAARDKMVPVERDGVALVRFCHSYARFQINPSGDYVLPRVKRPLGVLLRHVVQLRLQALRLLRQCVHALVELAPGGVPPPD